MAREDTHGSGSDARPPAGRAPGRGRPGRRSQTGRIVGTVRDPQQATVPRATVTVTSAATGESLTVTANGRGDYVVTPVNPGRYQVTVVADRASRPPSSTRSRCRSASRCAWTSS